MPSRSASSAQPEDASPTRRAGDGLLKAVYALAAGIYNVVIRDLLGYRGHTLAADALVAHWRGGRGPVLDLGCGTGLTAEALLRRVQVDVDGVDFSPAMLDRARRRNLYRHLIVADVTRPLPVAPHSYAGAVSSGLFTHGHVGAEALGPALEALAPGAVLAFTVNRDFWDAGGFGTCLAELEQAGRIEVLSDTTESHYARLARQSVRVVVLRVIG